MTREARREPTRPPAIAAPAAWVRTGAGVLSVLALVAVVVDGVVNGLSFTLMVRWIGVLAVAVVLLAGIAAAVSAVRGPPSPPGPDQRDGASRRG